MKKYPSVVILGRMNVGKSTLFNRLSRHVKSITLDFEGVTRDTLSDVVSVDNTIFSLTDTAGISHRKQEDPLAEASRKKALEALEAADLVLFLVDGVAGVTSEDREISSVIRSSGKKTILVINKADTKAAQDNQYECMQLGYKEHVLISAEHGLHINTLLDLVIQELPEKQFVTEEANHGCRVTLLGKPNVGKSSLLNALLAKERAIVSPIPGTTREPLVENITFYNENIAVSDTAGVRKKSAVHGDLENMMVKSTMQSLKSSDIVLLVMDGSEHKISDQELKLAFYAFTQQYKALILVMNKQDLVTDLSKKDLEFSLEAYKHLVDKVPLISISCKTGKNVGKIIPLINEVWKRYTAKFDGLLLYRLFNAQLQKTPLMHTKMPLLVYEVYPISTRPLTICLVVNESEWFGPSELAFFENILRREYDLEGVPVKFVVRKRKP
jgi:GTP-binding protein